MSTPSRAALRLARLAHQRTRPIALDTSSRVRAYTAGPPPNSNPGHSHDHTKHSSAKPAAIPKRKPIVSSGPDPPRPRHEINEGSEAISVPFNPPGGAPGPNIGGSGPSFSLSGNPLLDAALTTVIGLGMVFFGGVGYFKWYKKNVLDKIELAFEPGYDPALELARVSKHPKSESPSGKGEDEQELSIEIDGLDPDEPWTEHLRRKEQDWIDNIIKGEESGHYFVLLGPKGSGKGTMIFDAMSTINADGIAMCDAHPDLEVFRLRLGKALNYEYNEDTQTGLFQRRDPREGGPALDIERALNKLEKVALRCYPRRGKPLVLIINNVHFFQNDEEGRNMLLQLQQRAEAWAASGIMTMVFSSDDFWPFYVMRKSASRMHVLSIYDLDHGEAHTALRRMRLNAKGKLESPEEIKSAIELVGGRLSYLNRISKTHREMTDMAKNLLLIEKAWLQSQIGLIPDCDDDVMDEQKWSSCSWLLLREFVKARKEQEEQKIAESGGAEDIDLSDLPLPSIPYWKCRQIMTRADFLEELDRKNIIAIDTHHEVRPDSMLILHAAREVTEEEGFDELLDNVRDRIDEIESLHRTRELTFKDIAAGDKVWLTVDKGGARQIERPS
ncbi:hypothetical protein HGRIS_001979 [Hohenbuehelia grisea]|uniref:AAA protein C-terminal winged helix domain-containing protein n=1 Tax=Hohenbuehelia grisea TaxID=104357 RepID=A0ABR3JJI6_9AGAR